MARVGEVTPTYVICCGDSVGDWQREAEGLGLRIQLERLRIQSERLRIQSERLRIQPEEPGI